MPPGLRKGDIKPHMYPVYPEPTTLRKHPALLPERNQLHERSIVQWRGFPKLHWLQGKTHCRSNNVNCARRVPVGKKTGCLPSLADTRRTHLLQGVVYPEVCPWVSLCDCSPGSPLCLVNQANSSPWIRFSPIGCSQYSGRPHNPLKRGNPGGKSSFS
jgi:hypothetical protein